MSDRGLEAEPPVLPADALALLVAYRDDEAMPEDARRRVWREVVVEPPARRRRRAASSGRWGWWVGGGLAAAAMLLLGVHLLAGAPGEAARAIDPRPQTAPDRAVVKDSEGDATSRRAPAGGHRAQPEATASGGHVAMPDEPDEPDEPEATGPRRAPEKPRPMGPREAPSEPPVADAPALATDLAAERDLIAAAWRALAKGSPTQARTHAEAHARRFPLGMLAPEREAVHAIAACREAASPRPELADAFERAHPKSPLGARVRKACDPTTP